MKICVTGAAGFIGSHLCETLIGRGDSVIGIDDLSTGRLSNLSSVLMFDRFQFVRGSIGNPDLATRHIVGCDCVYHLASSVGVRRIIDRPVDAVTNIVRSTDIVFDICSQEQKPVLLTSTSEVYGKGLVVPFREEDDVVLGPTNSPRWSYAAAKMVDEFLGLAYFREYGMPVRIVRLFNTVGPRQTGQYGMVVPTFVNQAMSGRPITVYGDGWQTRCFASVRDIVLGLIAIMECKQAAGKVVNLGTDEEISINELARVACDVAKVPCTIQRMSHEEAYGVAFDDMRRRVPDLTRARELIGWNPQYSIRNVVEELVQCHAAN